MKIGIVVAMEREFTPIADFLEGCDSRTEGHFTFAWGTLGQHQVAVILAGIGKVHAALGTTMLIYHARPDCILNIGCSGAISKDLAPGDIVTASEVAYHDVWCGEGNAFGQVQGCPAKFTCHPELVNKLAAASATKSKGLFASGEFFIPSPALLSQLNTHFPDAIAVDMESAAVAQTCWIEGYPFASLRVISDTPSRAELLPAEQYQRFWNTNPDSAFKQMMNIVKGLE